MWLSGLLFAQGSLALGAVALLGLLLAWPRRPVVQPVAVGSAHSWARYRALVDASPDPLWLVDAAGQVVYVNARCVGLMEAVGPEELVGEPVQRFLEFPSSLPPQEWLNHFRADGPTSVWLRPLGGEPTFAEVKAGSFADPQTGETLVVLASREVRSLSSKVFAQSVLEAEPAEVLR